MVKSTLERELKLAAGQDYRLPSLPGEPLPARSFTSTYFDTPDFRLARAGITLRRRVEQARGAWQLKLPKDGARLELELPGGPATPPAELRDLVTATVRNAELVPVAKLRTHRSGVRIDEGGAATVDVTLDLVSVLENSRITASFRELEAELVDGHRQSLRSVERLLRETGATDGDGRSKLHRALDLEPLRPPAPPPREAPPSAHLAAALAVQARALVAHDPGTRLGDDPEELHQLRVATRRLRAYLRAARPILDRPWADALRTELAWLGQALGPVRDLDVLLERLRAESVDLGSRDQRALWRLFEVLEHRRAEAREALLDALRADRYLELLERIDEAAANPRTTSESVCLRDLARAEFRRLRRAARRLGDEPADEELHALRIRGKRARYAAELAATSDGKAMQRYLQEAKRFQDVLGEHQDAVVASAEIRAVLERIGGEALSFAAGRLVEREERRRRDARAALPAAWRALERAGRAAWT